MKTEHILMGLILVSVIIRYVWASFGWSGERVIMFPVFICLFLLLLHYYKRMTSDFYKIIIGYFALFLMSILFNIMEMKGRGILLFVGSLGFILFPVYFWNKRRSMLETNIFKYSLLLGILLITQTVFYLFIPTENFLTIAHVLNYIIVIVATAILTGKQNNKDLIIDEKKILTFIIIVSVLALLGVTFKRSFYSNIWL
ncbi:MAG: hypothetical protein K2X86_15845 [Cytophagaceae bacterium]|nr:hypothetical protein [Cytophagaceae bacterium]